MMTILNCISLSIILISMFVILFHPKIKMPIHVDIIVLIMIIGVSSVLINTALGSDLYGHLRNAEIFCRFGFALLTMRFTYQCLRGASK